MSNAPSATETARNFSTEIFMETQKTILAQIKEISHGMKAVFKNENETKKNFLKFVLTNCNRRDNATAHSL